MPRDDTRLHGPGRIRAASFRLDLASFDSISLHGPMVTPRLDRLDSFTLLSDFCRAGDEKVIAATTAELF
jgi:hypothetical protein